MSEPLDILLLSSEPVEVLHHGAALIGHHLCGALGTMGLRVAMLRPEPSKCEADHEAVRRGWSGPLAALRRRYARYDGVSLDEAAGAVALTRRRRPTCVVGIGLHSALYLRALRGLSPAPRLLWYGADELVTHHLSCLRTDPPAARGRRLCAAVQHGLMENLFVRGLDAAVGVAPRDTRMLRLIAGARRTATIRNGVDLEYFSPRLTLSDDAKPPAAWRAKSLVFWGRLDFHPNVDALRWFAQEVWPTLRWRWPEAVWRIVGRHASAEVRRIASLPGVEFVGEVEDLRPWVHASAVAILPMRCGGGIKNKLLEAAAMGKPIVASPRAVCGLEFSDSGRPLLVARRADQWVEAVHRLWTDAALAQRTGAAARQWVERTHTWPQAATRLVDLLGVAIPGGALRLRRAA